MLFVGVQVVHAYRKCVHLKNIRSRRYPSETISGADYSDNIELPANTPTQTKSLLRSLEQAAIGIGLDVNENKKSSCLLNKERSFPLQLLKLVEQFIYFGSNISSTERDINIRIGKAWIAFDRLSIIWKFDL